MNRILIIIATLFTLSACTSTTEKGTTTEKEQPAETMKEHDHENEMDEDELQLNNGAKWKLDESTRQNTSLIRQYLLDSPVVATSYQQLRQKTDKLVKDCRMEGKSHDVLHAWLKEFLDDLGKLEKATGAARDAAYAVLKKDMETFDLVFE